MTTQNFCVKLNSYQMKSKLLKRVRKQVTIEYNKEYSSYLIKVDVKFPYHSNFDHQRLISDKIFAYMEYRELIIDRAYETMHFHRQL